MFIFNFSINCAKAKKLAKEFLASANREILHIMRKRERESDDVYERTRLFLSN